MRRYTFTFSVEVEAEGYEEAMDLAVMDIQEQGDTRLDSYDYEELSEEESEEDSDELE